MALTGDEGKVRALARSVLPAVFEIQGWRVVLLVAGRDVRILGLDGAPLRHLRLDPTTNYQPMP